MSSEPPVISVHNLAKHYKLSHQAQGKAAPGNDTLAETLFGWAKRAASRPQREEFWAVKDVSFDVREGEVLGIIGRNGAGKSTLLKLLSRITRPSRGHFELRGRIGSLLEVGTGFHPELTGRENIFLNGAILGMTRREVKDKFDEIVAFSGVERFLDTPVKRFSSGMYVRLAFGVAAHLEPEILIVDEVLAVGDAEFQKKCLGKMRQVAGGGRTVLFVSHNMAAVQNLCTRCLLMQGGTVAFDGDTDAAVERYNAAAGAVGEERSGGDVSDAPRAAGHRPILQSVRVVDDRGRPISAVAAGRPAAVQIDFDADAAMDRPFFGVTFENASGVKILFLNTGLNGGDLPRDVTRGRVVCRLPRVMLVPGLYRLNVGCGSGTVQQDFVHAAATLQVLESDVFGTGRLPRPDQAAVLHDADWSLGETTHAAVLAATA